MRSLLLLGAAMFCGQIAITPVAHAADHEFCRHYASDAVRQVERAHEGRCWRAIDLRNPRWTRDFEAHYRWCRGEFFRAAERETEIRREELRRCFG